MKIHALWCHPRSVSTAFERIMRERGDLNVLHEPFMYHHYLNTTDRLFPGFTPEEGHPTTYDAIRDMIGAEGNNGGVFFKDMAYYVADTLPGDPAFAQRMSHAFLLRDPVEAAVSYAKRDPGVTLLELGHAAQHRLYCALVEQGHAPLVMTSDQLRTDPQATLRRYWAHVGLPYMAHAFSWDNKVPAHGESVASWHSEGLESGGIKAPETQDAQAKLEALGAPQTQYAAHHAPFYDRMRAIAEAQGMEHARAHQK